MGNPLSATPDPTANPGEFALIDNENGTLTLAIVNPTGKPSPIDPAAAKTVVESSDLEVVNVGDLKDFTWREEGVIATPPAPPKTSGPKGPAHHPHVDPHGASKAVSKGTTKGADITATVTWTGGTPYTLKWKDTVTIKPDGSVCLERGPITVTQ